MNSILKKLEKQGLSRSMAQLCVEKAYVSEGVNQIQGVRQPYSMPTHEERHDILLPSGMWLCYTGREFILCSEQKNKQKNDGRFVRNTPYKLHPEWESRLKVFQTYEALPLFEKI